MKEAVGESSIAPWLTEDVVGSQKPKAIKIQGAFAQGIDGLSEPKVGEVLEEKEMEDYPFRQEIEDLIKSPLRAT